MAKAKKAAAKGKPDADLKQQVEAQALQQLEGEYQAPEGAQAGLGQGVKNLGKIVKKVTPGIVAGVLAAGSDGNVSPGEIVAIVTEAVRKVIALGREPQPEIAPPAPGTDEIDEGTDTDAPDLSQRPA